MKFSILVSECFFSWTDLYNQLFIDSSIFGAVTTCPGRMSILMSFTAREDNDHDHDHPSHKEKWKGSVLFVR